jgi:hypothetical protein
MACSGTALLYVYTCFIHLIFYNFPTEIYFLESWSVTIPLRLVVYVIEPSMLYRQKSDYTHVHVSVAMRARNWT